jgi:SAM-dependent methyltransferase
MHLNSRLIFQEYALHLFRPENRVLEIGPDANPSTYRRAVPIEQITWHTIDLYSAPHLDFTATDEYSFPVPDASYDIVLSGQVVEHVRRVWLWMREVARVCKPGGVVITISPVNWPYHEAPIDCWRMYPEALRALNEDAGLITELATTAALEPVGHRVRYLAWQSARYALRKRTGSFARPIDAISIARKPRGKVDLLDHSADTATPAPIRS